MRMRPAALALTLLLSVASAVASAQEAAPTPQTHRIIVGGHAMRAQSYGLDARSPGTPVVVFEAGATNSLEVWGRVAPEVARFAPVVTYDRAGLGQSAWDGRTPTPEHVAVRLATLLGEIGAEPPYILVGFSWGGALVRYFAGLHPRAVAGIVYVDPGPIVTLPAGGELEPFEEIGAGQAGYDALWSGVGRAMGQLSEAIRAEFEVYSGLMRLPPAERRLLPVPTVPSVVILAGRLQPLSQFLQLPYDEAAHFEADLRHRIRTLSEWALPSPAGMVIVSRTSSHNIPMQDPALVTFAVQRVVSATRPQ